MKALLIKTTIFAFVGISAATTVNAQIDNPITTGSLPELLIAIIDGVILISVPIVVIAIVYAGFLFVTAQGNEQKITSAKQVLFWSLVGALILFGAGVIAELVCNTVETISSNPDICD